MFLLMWDLKLEAIRGCPRLLAGPFHQCGNPPTANTLYLIRLDEFRGEVKGYRIQIDKEEEREGKLSSRPLHEFQLLECKHKTARWTGATELCFSSDQVQLPLACLHKLNQ